MFAGAWGSRFRWGRAWLLALPVALAAPAPAADGVSTPKAGSGERKAILAALRAPVRKDLKKPVVFKVGRLKVLKGWALVEGVPQQPGGRRMEYQGTRYQPALDVGAFDDQIFALLRKRGTKWRVVAYEIGSTDVPYVDWDRRYGAPSAIFR